MDLTTSKKRKRSDDQNQPPNKSRRSESPKLAQNLFMSSGETGPDSLQPSREYITTSTSIEIPHVSSSESGGIAPLAVNLQRGDLEELDALIQDGLLEYVLNKRRFDMVITEIRSFFESHADLASKLDIVLANLHTTSPVYVEVNSNQLSQLALLNALSDAVQDSKVKTWKAVFSHQLFRPPPTEEKPSTPEEREQMEATYKGWRTEYVGENHHVLWEHLMESCSVSEKEKVYAFCSSIVQSSGMGKSRLVAKLSEEHVVIPCCLRMVDDGYPPADEDARDFLTERVEGGDVYSLRVQAFLMALLLVTRQILETHFQDPSPPGEKRIADFMRKYFEDGGLKTSHSDKRKEFYKAVVCSAKEILKQGKSEIVQETQDETAPNDTSPRRLRMLVAAEDLSFDIFPNAKEIGPGDPISIADLPKLAKEFLDYLSKSFEKERQGPLITLSWDEAHVLTNHHFHNATRSQGWTQFTEFRRVLRDCDRTGRLFSLFLSTTGNISQLSPDPRKDPSSRITRNTLHLPCPFINLDFDQFAHGLVDLNQGFQLSDAIQPRWIVKFGRPLWHTRFENGNEMVKTHIFDFAMAKLLCKQDLNEEIDKQGVLPRREEILAIMGLRLGLRLTAQNIYDADVAKALVERHMRVVMRMTTNLETIVTLAPSEPVLAEASIRLMRRWRQFHPAQALHQILGDSLHAKGERGEFIAALLILLARDKAQQEQEGGSAKIPLKNFLKNLLGDTVFRFLPNVSQPGKKATTLENEFEDAYVHFTHALVVQRQDMLTKDNIWPLIARGALPVCATGQRGVDLVIPVVQGDWVDGSTVTAILVQVKNDTASPSQCDTYFHKMHPGYTRFLPSPQGRKEFKHSFIRIVMAFQGNETGVTRHTLESFRKSNDYTAYDIVCRGITHDTYKVIEPDDVEGWRRCLSILGGYRECFKKPDGTDMSPIAAKTTHFRWPGADSTETFPYRWTRNGREWVGADFSPPEFGPT
ncbi:hypothetical protein CPB86DRAFT_815119 [Serendipita vermifera]|nr:hypothetical protein CPB86DRAFT_815119 [Serendipita vermifera]